MPIISECQISVQLLTLVQHTIPTPCVTALIFFANALTSYTNCWATESLIGLKSLSSPCLMRIGTAVPKYVSHQPEEQHSPRDLQTRLQTDFQSLCISSSRLLYFWKCQDSRQLSTGCVYTECVICTHCKHYWLAKDAETKESWWVSSRKSYGGGTV